MCVLHILLSGYTDPCLRDAASRVNIEERKAKDPGMDIKR